MRRKVVALALAALAGALASAGARAAPAASPMGLVETISVAPANRPALREDLVAGQGKRLAAWRARGVVASYRLLFNRYADAGSWDAMEILTFAGPEAQSRWNRIEQTSPAGLDARALALAASISSTPTDLVREGSARSAMAAGQGPFLVIPYRVQAPIPDYLKYSDGYVVPQMKGWMAAGVLAEYELHVGRYYAGRSWTSLLVLHYRDDAALARRQSVVEAVRAQLARDPAWKAIADNKHEVRAEEQLAVADQLASGGVDP